MEKIKHLLRCDDNFWNKVLKYKIDNGFENNNTTVMELIRIGLKKIDDD